MKINRSSLRAEAETRLESVLTRLSATAEECSRSRKLFREHCEQVHRAPFGVIIDQVVKALLDSRTAAADTTSERA